LKVVCSTKRLCLVAVSTKSPDFHILYKGSKNKTAIKLSFPVFNSGQVATCPITNATQCNRAATRQKENKGQRHEFRNEISWYLLDN
jgi:hypothetical protein